MKLSKLAIIILPTLLISCSVIPNIQSSLKDDNLISKEGIESEKLVYNSNNWWEKYNDQRLNKIIEYTLDANKDLKIAELNIKKAEIGISSANSKLGPTVDLKSAYTREKFSENGAMPVLPGYEIVNDKKIGLESSYNIDFFNKYSSQVKAALNQKEAMEFSADWIKTNIVNNVTGLYGEFCYLKLENDYLLKKKEILSQLIQMEKNKIKIGKATKDTQLELSSTLKSLDIQIENNKLNRETIENNLSLMTGMRYKNEIHNTLSDVFNSDKESENSIIFKKIFIPNQISSEVVRYRPDIKYYLKLIDSQKETLNSLKADFYPQIKIQGDLGFEAIDPMNPFKKSSQFGILGVGLSLPIFNSGAIKANYKLGGMDLNLFIEDYNKALLSAFNDINNEMLGTKNSKKSLEISRERFAYESETYKLASEREKNGSISKNSLLNSEYSFVEKSLELLQAKYSLYNQQLKLINSVGGVLENR